MLTIKESTCPFHHHHNTNNNKNNNNSVYHHHRLRHHHVQCNIDKRKPGTNIINEMCSKSYCWKSEGNNQKQRKRRNKTRSEIMFSVYSKHKILKYFPGKCDNLRWGKAARCDEWKLRESVCSPERNLNSV